MGVVDFVVIARALGIDLVELVMAVEGATPTDERLPTREKR